MASKSNGAIICVRCLISTDFTVDQGL